MGRGGRAPARALAISSRHFDTLPPRAIEKKGACQRTFSPASAARPPAACGTPTLSSSACALLTGTWRSRGGLAEAVRRAFTRVRRICAEGLPEQSTILAVSVLPVERLLIEDVRTVAEDGVASTAQHCAFISLDIDLEDAQTLRAGDQVLIEHHQPRGFLALPLLTCKARLLPSCQTAGEKTRCVAGPMQSGGPCMVGNASMLNLDGFIVVELRAPALKLIKPALK